MRDNSNTFIYIIASIIILHFLVGFGYLIYKMTKKPASQKEDEKMLKAAKKD
ncbi:hypothetical protein [Tenacibaculum finnmarkense]|uniref:Uncharacterized protein n=1 Tax=Tenacibaculum finnmarkense genomovar ulcerans TaxID=2781388 RepID=A0A2I2M7T1_9FLAO|nr:hypothetical protein [Tenacibaculum finnmarkense]MCD8399443.1 hypothetical protein [Tenacibaculum finnmarkense genomovar ulcerans]MCD8421492.1 hypothetical protein [Tenacibaculum finnmarkense genomovar ulcerans]MCD8431844.1 hypothetical protein [Tenacibaculum finnmarkense genomovar ulcerans]MCD8443485.1 hypothetical protein [Tenacibaculum finnmarkense genomovar ulcerans]MCD8453567.1 hypothetical protein [Tenacibaculum finnmarkense genomovar ulcerans]